MVSCEEPSRDSVPTVAAAIAAVFDDVLIVIGQEAASEFSHPSTLPKQIGQTACANGMTNRKKSTSTTKEWSKSIRSVVPKQQIRRKQRRVDSWHSTQAEIRKVRVGPDKPSRWSRSLRRPPFPNPETNQPSEAKQVKACERDKPNRPQLRDENTRLAVDTEVERLSSHAQCSRFIMLCYVMLCPSRGTCACQFVGRRVRCRRSCKSTTKCCFVTRK